jgi:hypothetical protein
MTPIIIHIINTPQGWKAIARTITIGTIISNNKNKAVQKTVAFLKDVTKKAVVIIHGLDGRVLEERVIENLD